MSTFAAPDTSRPAGLAPELVVFAVVVSYLVGVIDGKKAARQAAATRAREAARTAHPAGRPDLRAAYDRWNGPRPRSILCSPELTEEIAGVVNGTRIRLSPVVGRAVDGRPLYVAEATVGGTIYRTVGRGADGAHRELVDLVLDYLGQPPARR